MLNITCERCGAVLQIPEKYAGQPGRCNHCGGPILVADFVPEYNTAQKVGQGCVIFSGLGMWLGCLVILSPVLFVLVGIIYTSFKRAFTL
jgi:DNA-directed RNA polymerase subunit RPC12/RpoP